MRSFGCCFLALLSIACGDDSARHPEGTSYLPVAVGNRWVFDEVTLATQTVTDTITKEISGQETYRERQTFVRLTRQVNSIVTKRSNWQIDGVRVIRLRQDRLDSQDNQLDYREYDPGFLRLSDALTEAGAVLQESHTRSQYSSSGTLLEQKVKSYTWSVEAVDEEITVPAGTFSCVRVHRVDGDVGEKTFWYADGVGKILERGDGEEERLREYEISP